ncbi:DUF6457 domain-containing protein [Aestuariimicrobium sp. Y1814]|uniref:DUF6457 domain-containing protein n=1 Tax=Aestuariimicrobium sp. Y1814 TaxID=3418742 RepID=UPI003DA743F8
MAEDRSEWRPFIERASAAVGVDPNLVDEEVILGLTVSIAHLGVRPMAPVGAFILGLAVAGGGDASALRAEIEKVIEAE